MQTCESYLLSESFDVDDDLDVVFQKGAESISGDTGRKRSLSTGGDSSASKKARMSPTTVDL